METKFFLQSKTILGAVLIALAMVAPVFGVDFKADDANVIMANLDTIAQSVGLLMVVWGRVTASLPVSISGAKQ